MPQQLTVVKSEPLPPRPSGRMGGPGPAGQQARAAGATPLSVVSSEPIAAPVDPPVGGIEGFAKRAWEWLSPVEFVKGMGQMAGDIPGTVRAMGQAQGALFEKAKAEAARGNYAEAVPIFLHYLTPLLGPALEEQRELIKQGRWAEATGSMTGMGGSLIAPGVIGKIARGSGGRAGAPMRNPNALEREAVAFGEREGVPIDAATRSGRPIVARMQQMAGDNLGGAGVAEKFQLEQANALERTMQKLTGRTSLQPVTAEQAGLSTVRKVEDAITRDAQRADDAYARLRQFEQNATPTTVQQPVIGRVAGHGSDSGQVATTQPVQMRLAVDLRPLRDELRPIYEDLVEQNRVVPFVSESGKARALLTLRKIFEGKKDMHGNVTELPPDFMPLSTADSVLGELKAMARGARIPALRTQGQGVAAQAVKNLEAAVTNTATQAGPDVLAALKEGRAATVSKHATAEILERLTVGTNNEGVRVAGRITAPNDSAAGLLRELNQVAPDQMPVVARSVLEGLLEKQTQGGIFGKSADGLYRAWHNLGPQTKAILFRDRGLIRDLDNFFLLAKKVGQNPNPSGSARSINATKLIAALPNWAMAKLFYSPRAVKSLSTGIRIPASDHAGQAAWAAEFAKVAHEAGVSLTPAGAIVEGQERDE